MREGCFCEPTYVGEARVCIVLSNPCPQVGEARVCSVLSGLADELGAALRTLPTRRLLLRLVGRILADRRRCHTLNLNLALARHPTSSEAAICVK